MFGIGMNEMMMILVIAVIIIGPRQLPQMARTMGKVMAQFRRATNELRTAVNDEISQQIEMDELKEIRSSLQSDLDVIGSEARKAVEAEFNEENQIGGSIKADFQEAASVVHEGMESTVAEAEAELEAEAAGKKKDKAPAKKAKKAAPKRKKTKDSGAV